MAPPVPKLTLVPYLQAWDPSARSLTLHVLITPTDDPRQPLTQGWSGDPVPAGPPFQGSSIVLEPHVSADLSQLPNRADIPGSGQAHPLSMADGDQGAIFDLFADRFDLSLPATAIVRSPVTMLQKYLPRTYRKSFAFVRPRSKLAFIDDTYHCALRCPADPNPPGLTPTKQLSWGDAYGMILRQPPVARAAGFVHTLVFDVGAAFDAGGWLFFGLHPSSDFHDQWAADARFAKVFATRVPALRAGAARPVFSPVLFPVAADAGAAAALGSFDSAYADAQAFDDGFSKVVHSRQPTKNDLSDDDEGTPDLPPVTDAGIQLGWDDEDVVENLNRAVGVYPDGTAPPEAPSGVAGYRVDVRPASTSQWHSLCGIRAKAFKVGSLLLDPFDAEMRVEVHPNKLQDRFWLPAYFARWQGTSLVADTPDQRLLLGRHDDAPDLYEPLAADAVPLRYGERYQFRVRLADATGGGPGALDSAHHPAEAPVSTLDFRRHVPPRPVVVAPMAPVGSAPPTDYRVSRPGIAYPQATFAGAPDAQNKLAAIARANLAAGAAATTPVEVPDPDTEHLEVTVMVRPPRFDEVTATEWKTVYSTYRAFPALAADGDAAPLDLTLEWVDCARLSDIAWENPTLPPGNASGPIPVPTARDVRVMVRAVGSGDAAYWGDGSHLGQPVSLSPDPLHVAAGTEPALFGSNDAKTAIASVFMQPDPAKEAPTQAAVLQHVSSGVLTKRLATACQLMEDQGTIFGAPGQRVLFGCAGLKHHLPPDGSSLMLTAGAELARQWINVVRLNLDRDWTWRGLGTPSLRVRRLLRLLPNGGTSTLSLGTVSLQHAVNRQATLGTPDRERTELIFIDAFVPPLKDDLPYPLQVTYEVEATFESGETETFSVDNQLPVTTPPTQLPRVASVGHAFSPYTVAEDYASTGPRQRRLWVEFAEPPRDPRDVYFARVLTSAPDPMLMPATEPAADPPGYQDPPLDPELIRVIRPGQPDDFAGLSAMQRLVPASDDPEGRFYLVPLPPNTASDSKDLFGFFTYEFRVGHDRSTPASPFWSTAQGRFGPGLALEGVQHPAPQLDCQVQRVSQRVEVMASFAQAAHDGRDVSAAPPNTDLWFALYARVMQADGATRRPIQLDARRGRRRRPKYREDNGTTAAPPAGRARWTKGEIEGLLKLWGLPPDTPLSALAVELLPEPNGRFAEPIGGDLSQVRILRTSPLVEVAHDCCT